MASTRSLNVNLVGARCRNGELLNAIHHGHLVGAILRITVALRRPIPALSPTIGERHHNLAIRLQIHRRKAIPALVLDPIAATSAVAIDVVDARVVEVNGLRIKVAGGLIRAAKAAFEIATPIVQVRFGIVVAGAFDVAAFHHTQVAILIHIDALPRFGEVAGKGIDAGGLGLAGKRPPTPKEVWRIVSLGG